MQDVDDDYTLRNVDLRSAATSRALMSEDDISGGQYAAVGTDDGDGDGGGLNLDAVIYSELLVSRQYVHAYRTQEKNENTGRVKEVVHRDKRAWRCNGGHSEPTAHTPQPTAHDPRPMAHGPQPTAHSPQPTTHSTLT